MNFVFVCSSLEEGRDGVGDYTRRLAAELIKRGNHAAILSVNDKYVDEIFADIQQSDGVDINVMRMPSFFSAKERLVYAKKWINQYDPEWLSLQFVPFGFHPKGLQVGLSSFLLSLSAGRNWHIMFHELWVGMAVEESKKLYWWGQIQRYLIKSLIIKLRPVIIHTQTRLYQSHLNKLGFKAGYLPLFTNIPAGNEKINHQFKKNISSLNEDKISFVVFGTIHSGAPVNELTKEIVSYSRKNNIPVVFTFIGRCGPEQDRWAVALTAEGLKVEMLGELPAAHISEILLNATIGVSATALAVIEKSGSVAAMLGHGLPVLCVSKPWHPRGMPKQQIPAGIVEYRIGDFEAIMTNRTDIPYVNNVSDIAIELEKSLSKFH